MTLPTHDIVSLNNNDSSSSTTRGGILPACWNHRSKSYSISVAATTTTASRKRMTMALMYEYPRHPLFVLYAVLLLQQQFHPHTTPTASSSSSPWFIRTVSAWSMSSSSHPRSIRQWREHPSSSSSLVLYSCSSQKDSHAQQSDSSDSYSCMIRRDSYNTKHVPFISRSNKAASASTAATVISKPHTATQTKCLSYRKKNHSSFNHQQHTQSSWMILTTVSRTITTSLLVLLVTFLSPMMELSSLSTQYTNSWTTTRFHSTLHMSSSFTSSSSRAWAEDELLYKYQKKGFDPTLVDQTCLVQHCNQPIQTCLVQDTNCRKGLVCTAKCLGDNACITGCMARYGNEHLDEFLKCTIEDHDCIQIAIIPGKQDTYEEAPLAPIPTISKLDISSLEGSWYKIIGFNPNYDCYPCQRNTFTSLNSKRRSTDDGRSRSIPSVWNNHPQDDDNDKPKLQVQVEFSMPRMIADDNDRTVIPISFNPNESSILEMTKESILMYPRNTQQTTMSSSSWIKNQEELKEEQQPMSIGLNEYKTQEIMIFDTPEEQDPSSFVTSWFQGDNNHILTLGKDTTHPKEEVSYRRTAHSQGEMFGLKFWENWYIIGENDPGMQEFKFVYYNGKTRQNTYQGAFVYSRSKSLNADALRKVYQIATDAGMNPNQFCKIQNGCFQDDEDVYTTTKRGTRMIDFLGSPSNPFRGILASTKVSQLLGVEPVAAEGVMKSNPPLEYNMNTLGRQIEDRTEGNLEKRYNMPQQIMSTAQVWYTELGDYLENPHRHFDIMDSLRVPMKWPDDVDLK